MLKASHFSTRTVQNTDNRATLSKVTISKAKKSSPTLQLTSTEYLRGDRGVLSLLLLRNNLQLTSYAASWILPFVLRFQTSLSSNDLETRTHRKIIYSLLRCSLFPSTLQFVFFSLFLVSRRTISGSCRGAPAPALGGTGCSWGLPSQWGLMGWVGRCGGWRTSTRPSDRGETSCTETQNGVICVHHSDLDCAFLCVFLVQNMKQKCVFVHLLLK